jgi:hypothetical protein
MTEGGRKNSEGHLCLLFCLFWRQGLIVVAQAGLELLDSRDPPASAS